MSGPIIDLPLVDWYWDEDPSLSLLVNGDFEGAAGPPPFGWTQYQSLMTRQAGHRTGGSGSFVGQVAYDGSHAFGAGRQIILVNGAPYHVAGWAQGDGTSGVTVYIGGAGGPAQTWTPGAGPWSNLDRTCFADGTGLWLGSTNLSAGHLVQFDDWICNPLIARTKNIGLLQGAAQLGDGQSSATFPIFIGGGRRGVRPTANFQRLQATIPALGNDGTFFCHAVFSPIQLAAAGSLVQIGAAAAWLGGGTLVYVTFGTGTITAWWGAGASAISANAWTPGPHSFALSVSAGYMSMYWDGRLVAGPGGVAAPVTRTDWEAIGDVSAYSPVIGDYDNVSVWPYGLTATEVRALHDRAMAQTMLY